MMQRVALCACRGGTPPITQRRRLALKIAIGKGDREMNAEIEMKGQAVRQYISVFEDLKGEAALNALIESVENEEFRELLADRQILASGWYPVAWMNEFLEKALEAHPDTPDLPERIGYASADRNIRGIYRFLAQFLSPEMCIKQVPRMWKVYMRGIKVEAEVNAPRQATLRFHGIGPSRLTWRAMLDGGARRIFESSGAKNIKVNITSGGIERSSLTTVDVRWTA